MKVQLVLILELTGSFFSADYGKSALFREGISLFLPQTTSPRFGPSLNPPLST
jgi:hypothetical protein